MRTFGARLRNQLILIFVVTISFVLAFVFITTYQQAKNLLKEQSASITSQYFTQNKYNIQTFMGEIDKDAKLLIMDSDVSDYIDRGWENEFSAIMTTRSVFDKTASMMSNNDAIVSVFYFGSDGEALGITDRGNYVHPKSDDPLDYVHMGIEEIVRSDLTKTHWIGGFSSSDFYVEEPWDPQGLYTLPCITAARSLNYNGIHKGTLIINVKESAFADLITKSDSSGRRESYITDSYGEIVVHQDPLQIGKISEVLPEDMDASGNAYLIKDGIQVNYSQLKTPGWFMISEVPLENVYQDINTLRDWFIIIFVIAIIASISISFYWLYRLMQPLDKLRLAMYRMEKGEMGEQLDETCRNELGLLGRQFNKMSKSISQLISQIQTAENEKRILEMEALKMQINPHFLYNTLSNIKYMAMIIHSKTITEAVTALGNMLSPMYRSSSEFWTIEEELDFLGNYIKIMNYRFGNGIRIVYDIPEDLRKLKLLKFVLQPLLENAITHGFEQSDGCGEIVLTCREQGDDLVVTVSDNGQGIAKDKLFDLCHALAHCANYGQTRKGHIGLVNVHRRLQIYFGNGYGIKINSIQGKGTNIEMLVHIVK